jgi:16S rRNA processing protein RimM
MEFVKIGKITAPVGIKGEVRVYPFTDESTRFSDMKKLYLDEAGYEIENVRYSKDMVVLKLGGVDNRNDAQALRGKELFLDKALLWDIPEDTYFIKDLIGLHVQSEEGEPLGILTQVIKSKAQDLYEITGPDGRPFLLPAVKEFILHIDMEKRQLTAHLIEGMKEL